MAIDIYDKNPNNFNELVVSDLPTSYSTIYTMKDRTFIDIHVKMDDAKELYNELKQYFENQVVSPSVDR